MCVIMKLPHKYLFAEFVWAQSDQKIFLTVNVDSAVDTKVNFTNDSVGFEARRGADSFAVTIKLKGEIKPEESTFVVKGRGVECLLQKAADGRWETLLADKSLKNHCKVDWDLWADSDDEEKDAGDFGMGGMGGAMGMGGMGGGMGGMDFSQFGGLGGDDGEGEDDLPELEAEDDVEKPEGENAQPDGEKPEDGQAV